MSANRNRDQNACSPGQDLIQNDFSLWIQQLMSFPHHRDRLLIWEEYWCFPFAFFFLFVLKPDSSQTKQLSPILPRIVPGQEIHSHILWHKVLTHSTHGSARGRTAFPYAQNRVLINPGHMCRSGALPLSVDNLITQSVGGTCQTCQLGGQCNERSVRTFKNEVTR